MSFESFLAALPTVASSWQAVVAYIALVIAVATVALKVTRNRNLLDRIKSIPERDRTRALEMEMGAGYLSTGLSPEQWLRQKRQQYYLFAFLAACVLVAALFIATVVSARGGESAEVALQRARDQARSAAEHYVSMVYKRDFEGLWDAYPDDYRKNVGFAQFRADAVRALFQLPQTPLKSTVDNVTENAGFLNVLFITEFSTSTKVRDVVSFARVGADWRLVQYNWQPFEWPLYWPTSTTIRLTAAEALKIYGALDEQERAVPLPARFRGNITGSTPGWRLVVASTSAQQDEGRVCDVETRESDSSTFVDLSGVIGGCALKPGQRLLVHALLAGVNISRIKLEAVHLLPES